MPYRLTFEDGSDGYLEHHGVQGMHWGIWNAETRARYSAEGKTQQGGGCLSDEDVDELTEALKRRNEDYDSLRDSQYLNSSDGNDQDYKTDRHGNTLSYRYEGGSFGSTKHPAVLARQKKGQKEWEHLTMLGVTSKYVSDVSGVVNRRYR